MPRPFSFPGRSAKGLCIFFGRGGTQHELPGASFGLKYILPRMGGDFAIFGKMMWFQDCSLVSYLFC